MTNPNDKRSMQDIAESIIAEAKSYKMTSNRKMTYKDYEHFKCKLHCYDVYGYEHELADALGV